MLTIVDMGPSKHCLDDVLEDAFGDGGASGGYGKRKPAPAADLQRWSKNSADAQELQRIVAHPEFDRNELPQEIYKRHKCFHKYGLNRFRTQLNKMKEMCNKKSNNRAVNKLGTALGKSWDLCLHTLTCLLTS